MEIKESAQNEIHIGFRIPTNLREAAQTRMQGKFSTFSEYLRDLIRRDSEKEQEARK
jgi:hypothetical protein